MIQKLDHIFDILKQKDKKHLVVACANESHTISAVNKAMELGLVKATLVGNKEMILRSCREENISINNFEIVHEANDQLALSKAVELVRIRQGDILMKGLVSSDKYMRAILNKEFGLLPPKATLTHIAIFDVPSYPKLLICSDVAIIPAPDLKQKILLTNHVIHIAHKLGIEKPKVAIISATEQVIPAMETTTDAAIIAKMAARNQLKKAEVDGPLALDVALDEEAVRIKKLRSNVAGDADCLVFPNIESGNVFYKACTKLANAELGGIVVGAKAPCVLSSRGDSTKTKLYSIAMGVLLVS